MDKTATPAGAASPRPPEPPRDPMEFLSRSWSLSSLDVSMAVVPYLPASTAGASAPQISEDLAGEVDDDLLTVAGNPFSFASSVTSQLVMERIMSQSQEASPRTSGRFSYSSGPLTGGGQSGGSLTDSPPISPSGVDDVKYMCYIQYCRAGNTAAKPQHYGGDGNTVGRWLKDRRERKKEAARAHNADLHAAISVAGVASAVAAIAAATAADAGSGKDVRAARTNLAVASAATLVAAQCVEAAEAMGAERDHLTCVVGSAVNARSPGDIITLTAAAATALRGAATLKARALKDVWNIAAVIPVMEKGHDHSRRRHQGLKNAEGNNNDELVPAENFLGLCSQQLLARGTELLKRTRKGVLHWKIVSVYINRTGQVMLKTKSKHVAGTITKKKKSVIIEVCKNISAWPGRHLLEGGEQRHYFGLRTVERRVIEFECKGQKEYEMWTQGVSRLLSIVGERMRLP